MMSFLVLQEYLLKEYAGAMLVQVMQILAGLWCGRSICSQLSLVHMIGRGSRQKAKIPNPYLNEEVCIRYL